MLRRWSGTYFTCSDKREVDGIVLASRTVYGFETCSAACRLVGRWPTSRQGRAPSASYIGEEHLLTGHGRRGKAAIWGLTTVLTGIFKPRRGFEGGWALKWIAVSPSSQHY